MYVEFHTCEHVKFKSRQDGSKVLKVRVAAPSGEAGGKRAGGFFLAAPVEKTASGFPGMTLGGPACLRTGHGCQEGSVQCPLSLSLPCAT